MKAEEHTAIKVCPVCKESFASDVTTCPTDFILLNEIDPFIGRLINEEFIVESFIGQGGMSKVYLGRQERGRPVAIKVLKPLGRKASVALKRMQREAVIVGQLNHRNIAKIYSSGITDQGKFYLVMEYIDGKNLWQLSESHALDPIRCFEILFQLAEALAYAHNQGVVHRDVKPTNIVVCVDSSGHELTKLIDFGHAWHVILSQDSRLTRQGEVLGTPTFMAPEQLNGEDPDVRWDIYAFGAVASMLLSSEGLVPVVCKELIDRCLQENKELRYQSMTAVLQELEKIRSADSDEIPAMALAGATRQHHGQKRWTDGRQPLLAVLTATLIMFAAVAIAYCYYSDEFLPVILNAGVSAGVLRFNQSSKENDPAPTDKQINQWLISLHRTGAAQKYLELRTQLYRAESQYRLLALAGHDLIVCDLLQKDEITARTLRKEVIQVYQKSIDTAWRVHQWNRMSDLIQKDFQLSELDLLSDFEKTHGQAAAEQKLSTYYAKEFILQYYGAMSEGRLIDTNIVLNCLDWCLSQIATKQARANALSNIDNIHSRLIAVNREQDAMSILNKAVKLESAMQVPCKAQLKRIQYLILEDRVTALSKQVNAFVGKQQYAAAVEILQRIADIAKQQTEGWRWRTLGTAYTRESACYRAMGKLDQSEEVIKQALSAQLDHSDEIGPAPGQITTTYLEMGLLRQAQRRFKEADACFDQSTIWARKQMGHANRTFQRATILYHMGRTAVLAGDPSKGQTNFEEAIKVGTSVPGKIWPSLPDCRAELAELIKRGANAKHGNAGPET